MFDFWPSCREPACHSKKAGACLFGRPRVYSIVGVGPGEGIRAWVLILIPPFPLPFCLHVLLGLAAHRRARSRLIYLLSFSYLSSPSAFFCHCSLRALAPHIVQPTHRPRCDPFAHRQMFYDRALCLLPTATTL
ncbi:uncharacterized protein SCHCODRAFT_02369271 [Schizophyllum commune H4-8]|uniref:uncharacterized protein n=1 Tax=Schizophyllum commune (strain H4-8 / FGSC 9210) TaxID=578458 RepID=UPI0021610B7D|nr:uncharacterized protein SCHCODRAFT_02369271 [Schizophyllum commune H4-8]KAI5889500.1 hypothetical protein SCHCODRAFT_02369271 [Schizophyllum commune H4-8]